MNTLMNHISSRGVAGTSNSHKVFKAIARLLVVCIANGYVWAGNRATQLEVARHAPTTASTAAWDKTTNIALRKLILGRLSVPYYQEILVNGHSAMSGDIIISGSRLQNTAVDPVKVEIGSIANLVIEPNTDLVLTFDPRSVEVKVMNGNAILSTSDGVKGEVTMPDGELCPIPHAQSQEPPPPSIPAIPLKWWEELELVGVGVGTTVIVIETRKVRARCRPTVSGIEFPGCF